MRSQIDKKKCITSLKIDEVAVNISLYLFLIHFNADKFSEVLLFQTSVILSSLRLLFR